MMIKEKINLLSKERENVCEQQRAFMVVELGWKRRHGKLTLD
jgi:hypothetical protein